MLESSKMMFLKKITKIKNLIIDLIFPKTCLVCSQEGSYLCESCLEKLPLVSYFYCFVCHKISVLGRTCESCQKKTGLSGIIYAADYKNQIINQAIKLLKYKSVKDLASPLAQLLIKIIKNSHFLSNNFSADSSSFIIIPIPLHRKKFLWRGFNQSELLAEKLAKEFELELKTDVLFKIKNTRSQTDLKEKERHLNIKDTFGVKNKNMIKEKIIFLIDDVMTTGSTLNEAAKTLKKAGAQAVWGITLARG